MNHAKNHKPHISRQISSHKKVPMKFIASVVLALATSFITGCATPPPPAPAPEFSVSVKSEKNSGVASVEIKPIWEFGDIFNATGVSGFEASVKNNSNRVARIVWAKSSISHGGNTHLIFVSGQKFMDSSTPMAATVLPANGQMTKNIYSAAQPIFTTGTLGGWKMRSITSSKFVIVLCVESGETEEYFTVEISK